MFENIEFLKKDMPVEISGELISILAMVYPLIQNKKITALLDHSNKEFGSPEFLIDDNEESFLDQKNGLTNERLYLILSKLYHLD